MKLKDNTKKTSIIVTVSLVLTIILPSAIFVHLPSYSQTSKSTKLSENTSSFTFEIVAELDDYFIVRVIEVQNAPEIKVGDIYYIGKPQMPESVRFGETLGWDERGFFIASIEPEEILVGRTYYISGTVYPGYVNPHGYHYLYTTTKVDIEVSWTPTNQVIALGLIYWATSTFYYVYGYDGYEFVSMYPPYNGYYSIGIGNPSWNQYPINYQGSYTIWPPE